LHTGFRLVPTSMTLNDLGRRNSPYFAFLHGIRQIFRLIISQWLKIDLYNVRKILSLSSSVLLLARTITQPAARSLCDSWASCYGSLCRTQLYSVLLSGSALCPERVALLEAWTPLIKEDSTAEKWKALDYRILCMTCFMCSVQDHWSSAVSANIWIVSFSGNVWLFSVICDYCEKNLAVYDAFQGRHPQTRRSKTANITKDDITYAAHCQNVTVLRSNIIFCDICCFRSASLRMSSLKGVVNC